MLKPFQEKVKNTLDMLKRYQHNQSYAEADSAIGDTMKRLFQLFALTVAVAATLSAEVPTGTHLKQGNVNLYVTQLTAEPIFNVPGAVPGGDWHEWFIVSVWNTADLPVEAFRVTVTCTLHGRTTVNTQVLPRYMSAGAEGIPISGFFHLGADAKITSVLVEELVPVASEQF